MSTTDAEVSTVVAGLHRELPVSSNATTSRTAVNNAATRVVSFAMDAGEELTDHASSRAVVVLVTEGRLSFTVAGQSHDLGVGDVVYLAPGERHAVRALEPCRFVLVMTSSPGPR